MFMPIRHALPGLVAVALAALPTAASADATFDCSGSSGPFHVATTVAIGAVPADSIGAARGTVDIKTRPLPPDLTTVALTRTDLVHHWVEGDQVNLHFYRERNGNEPSGFVEVVLTTRRTGKSDEDYSGRFRMKVSFLRKTGDTEPVEFMTMGLLKCTLG
jgi:hypothetical protein